MSTRKKPRVPRADKQCSPFAAVAIRPAPGACQASKDTRGTRYLATEARLLPLQGCDRCEHCDCKYVHYADRRRGPRRRAEGAPPSSPQLGSRKDRRSSRSRRAEDFIEDEFVGQSQTVPSLDDTYYGFNRRAKTLS